MNALPGRTVAIEALWDGDSDGWCVDLTALTDDPAAEYRLAIIRHGSDLRLFNGSVPPWPEAQEAATIGRALADRLGVPFHFASPDRPDLDAPPLEDHLVTTPAVGAGDAEQRVAPAARPARLQERLPLEC